MTRTSSWTLAALALIVCAGGIYMLVGRSMAPPASVSPEAAAVPAFVAPDVDASPGVPDKPTIRNTAEIPPKAAGIPPKANATPSLVKSDLGQAPPRAHLMSEASLLVDVDGHRGLDLRSISAQMRGDRFADFLDQLALEAAASPLALDITELYARSAYEANATVDDALAIRVVCGMSICFLSVTTPSREIFDTWFGAFLENPATRPHSVGRHEKVLDDGAVEHRISFSSDEERSHMIITDK